MGFAGMSDASASDDFLLNNNYASNNFGTGPFPTQQPQQQWNRQSGGFPAAQPIDPMIQGNQTPSGPYHPSGHFQAQQPQQQMQQAGQGYPPQQGYGQNQGMGQPPQGGFQSGPMPGLQGNAPPPIQHNAYPQQGMQQQQPASSSGSALLNTADLPPAPSDYSGDSVFAPDPELDQTALPPYKQNQTPQYQPQPEQAAPPRERTIAPARSADEESSVEFAINLITAIGMLLLLVVIVYVLFLTLGATVELIIDGPIRLIGTGIAALLIPLVPLVAEGGARERFAVVSSGLHKVRKAATVGVLINGISILMLCVVFSGQIVGELRAAPNWFLNSTDPENESGFAALNRSNSYMLADLIEESMLATGMQKKRASDIKMPEPPKPTRPDTKSEDDKKTKALPHNMPKPTRPDTKKPSKGSKDVKRDRRGNKLPPEKKPEKDGDYVKW